MNDRQFRVWRSFGVGAWPTVVVLDPAGGVVGAVPGEFLAGQLAPTLDAVIAEFDRADAPEGARLRRGPAPLSLPPAPTGPLAYPGKVLAARERASVRDRHRPPSRPRARGRSRARARPRAARDRLGRPWRDRRQRRRRRLRPSRGHGRHARAPASPPVSPSWRPARPCSWPTPATTPCAPSTCRPARSAPWRAPASRRGVSTSRATATTVPLSSPWDVELLPAPPESTLSLAPTVIVAMAGVHQLWRIDLVTRSVEPWVGTGPRGHHGRAAVPLHAGAARRSAACRPAPVLRRLRVQRRTLRRSGRPRRPRGRDHRGQGLVRLRR